MTRTTPVSNWAPSVRLMHWLSAAMVIACIGAVWFREMLEKGHVLVKPLMQTHFSLGLLILAATLVRLYVRSRSSAPATGAGGATQVLAKAVHVAFYVALLALPVLGYMMVSGRGAPIIFFYGLVELPPLPVTKELAGTAREIHKTMGTVLAGVIGLHLAAVLWHALVLRDKVLAGMLGRNKG